MKTMWKLVGIAALVAILGAAAVAAVAYAQEDADGYPFDFGGRWKEAIADILNITVEEYDDAAEQAQDRVVDEAVTEGWLTEEQAENFRWRMDQAPGAGMPGMDRGFRGPDRAMMGPGDNLHAIAADKLGLSITELLTELQDGKSIADVAAEKGVDTQEIVDAYVAKIQEDLDQAVAEGRITQNQADYQLERAQERVTDQLERTWEDGFRGPDRGMMGPGDNLHAIAADKLGLSITELLTELQDGKSIADVAAEKGVDTQEIVDAYVAKIQEDLDQAVAEGRITQNQADYQLERAQERVTDQLERTWEDGFRGPGGRHGGMMGLPGLGSF